MKKIGGLFVAIVCTFIAKAQLPAATTGKEGFVQEKLLRLSDMLQEYTNQQFVGGGVAIVAHKGKVVYYHSFGKNADGAAITKDAIFRIASQTKAITSVAIMQLYEAGKILLDDPLSKYIPSFANTPVLDKFNEQDTTYTTIAAKRSITIRDLLTHSSGLGYAQIGNPVSNAIYYKHGIVGGIGVGTLLLKDKMEILASLPLMHQPGEKFTYGLNTDLLGYLIEVVSGKTLDVYFQEHIFHPLGMKDTYFYLPANKKKRLTTLYTENTERKVVPAPDSIQLNGTFYVHYPALPGTYFSGGGGLSSTAMDYAIFMQMLLNEGIYNKQRILSKSSVRMMTTSQLSYFNDRGTKMGLGFRLYTEETEARSPLRKDSYEWGGMFSSTYWIDPKEEIVAQLFLNQYPNSYHEIHEKFKVMVYGALD